MNRRDRLFVDVSTTGLNLSRHQLVEVAFALNDAPPTRLLASHTLANASLRALEVIQYAEREIERERPATTEQLDELDETVKELIEAGGSLVCYDPGFDLEFLGQQVSVLRGALTIDVRSMAYALFGERLSLQKVAQRLRAWGFTIVDADFVPENDVQAMRQVYHVLLTLGEQYQRLIEVTLNDPPPEPPPVQLDVAPHAPVTLEGTTWTSTAARFTPNPSGSGGIMRSS